MWQFSRGRWLDLSESKNCKARSPIVLKFLDIRNLIWTCFLVFSLFSGIPSNQFQAYHSSARSRH